VGSKIFDEFEFLHCIKEENSIKIVIGEK